MITKGEEKTVANQNIIIPIIKKISEYQNPGKKVLQKLLYLIEKKGLNLGYAYSIHYYGPYSSELDYTVHSLEMQGLLSIKTEGMNHKIYPVDQEEDCIALLPEEEKIIDNILEIFGSLSAHQLELITTTDFVARNLYQRGIPCGDQDIVDGVKILKGEKFSPEKIIEAIALLKENGYRWD